MHSRFDNKHATSYFMAAVIVLGIALRIVAGSNSLGFVHPDEHQQYLEAANKIAFGYGVSFWEYERGIRHYLYPGSLAILLKLFDTIGISSPIHQAQIIRSLMGIGVFASVVMYSFGMLRQKRHMAAFSLLVLATASPFFIFVGARTLSETATIPLLMAMLYFLDRRPGTAGFLAGIMFAVRFQSALFVAPLFFAMVVQRIVKDRSLAGLKSSARPFAASCIASLLLVGFIDYCTWGHWFHSPIEYVRANVVENVASSFGVSPWYQYAIWAYDSLIESTFLIIPLVCIGAWYCPRLAFAMATFAVAHSFIGHKEPRFLWPMIPVVFVLVAVGIEHLSRCLSTQQKKYLVIGLSLTLIASVKFQWDATDWHMGRTETSALALARVREIEDVRGVALLGGDAHSGNLFYLRRDLPYLARTEWQELSTHALWKNGCLNYLIAEQAPEGTQFTLVSQVRDLSIFRVNP